MRHSQADDVKRGEDAGVDFFTDTYDDGIAVLHADFFQRLLIEMVGHKSMFCKLAHLPNLILVAVHYDDFLPCFCQALCQGSTETA